MLFLQLNGSSSSSGGDSSGVGVANVTHCAPDALTDSFGWFVQFVLASLAFALLIVKRFCEPSCRRRTWLVWFYDTSKQGFGAMFVHFINVYMASIFTGDPCSWYIVNFLLDSTVGLAVIFACVRGCQCLADAYNWPSINFGEYGYPPQAQYWLAQSVLYVLVQAVQKSVVMAVTHWPVWLLVSQSLLAPITDPRLEVVVSVLIVPFVVNAVMFWVIDNFLMRRKRQPVAQSLYPVVVSVDATTAVPRYGHTATTALAAEVVAESGENERLLRRSVSCDSCSEGALV